MCIIFYTSLYNKHSGMKNFLALWPHVNWPWSESENLTKQGVVRQDALPPIYLWPECGKALCTGMLTIQTKILFEKCKCQ